MFSWDEDKISPFWIGDCSACPMGKVIMHPWVELRSPLGPQGTLALLHECMTLMHFLRILNSINLVACSHNFLRLIWIQFRLISTNVFNSLYVYNKIILRRTRYCHSGSITFFGMSDENNNRIPESSCLYWPAGHLGIAWAMTVILLIIVISLDLEDYPHRLRG